MNFNRDILKIQIKSFELKIEEKRKEKLGVTLAFFHFLAKKILFEFSGF